MTQKDDQIIESILSINEIVLGSSASKSMSTMYLNLAQSAGMATQNAVSNQQHLNIIGMAAAAASVSGILRTNSADQVEKLTLEERVSYLKSLLSLAGNTPESSEKPSTEEVAKQSTNLPDKDRETKSSPATETKGATR
ncbi:RebB family R body protein [Sneathiella marina]|uniref:RebB family R body protein n=1 Tax=Sneathiella marina TaxID=2950108 RepID=A0ABY4W838_9PROT|nr:RebB family R body protein [Sneathiella marina]USG63069.1 RebB family R body protein [Sneathiella marina]